MIKKQVEINDQVSESLLALTSRVECLEQTIADYGLQIVDNLFSESQMQGANAQAGSGAPATSPPYQTQASQSEGASNQSDVSHVTPRDPDAEKKPNQDVSQKDVAAAFQALQQLNIPRP